MGAFRKFFVVIALALVWWSAPAAADEIRPAVMDFEQISKTEWSLDWKLPLAVDRSADPAFAVRPILPSNCAYAVEPIVRVADLAQTGHAKVQCDGPIEGRLVGFDGLFGRSDALLRYVPLATPVQTVRLTADSPTAEIAPEPSRWQVFQSYFIIGVEHILAGWDHLLFVIALVLLIVKPWPVIKAATAFTIAHSITLIASSSGYAGLPGRPVEALIALSIVFLAVELAKSLRDPASETWTKRAPWIVAFAFGLLHGFGFAGALAEIGMPEGEVPAALLAFNVGVEAGQLLVIAGLLALRAMIVQIVPNVEAPALKLATYFIGITASYWLFERILL